MAKKEFVFDPEVIKVYVDRLFLIESEINVLKDGKKELNEEYKGKIDTKLINNIIRLVKIQLKMTSSEETKEEVKNIILDKINMVID